MSKPYDPTLKAMVDSEPSAWLDFLGTPKGRATVVDGDMGTISGAADKVILVKAKSPYVLHLEFAVGHDGATLPPLLLIRNAVLSRRHDLPVRTVVVLLRPEADSPELSGTFKRSLAASSPYLRFEYTVVRVWKIEPATLLTNGLGLLPLAPIAAVTEADLPAIIRWMEIRLASAKPRVVPQIWGAAYLLFGLRHSIELAERLFQGVISMKESSTYQAILREGLAEGIAKGLVEGEARGQIAEAKRMLRLLGDSAFGPPNPRTAATIERMTDLDRLEHLLGRIREAADWNDVFGKQIPKSRKSD